MTALPNDLLSQIVAAHSRARIDALRAAANDPSRSPEEADNMRVLAGLFEAEHDSVNAVRESKLRHA
jgi:hypothetical protein